MALLLYHRDLFCFPYARNETHYGRGFTFISYNANWNGESNSFQYGLSIPFVPE